jgi:hypothetical protein
MTPNLAAGVCCCRLLVLETVAISAGCAALSLFDGGGMCCIRPPLVASGSISPMASSNAARGSSMRSAVLLSLLPSASAHRP